MRYRQWFVVAALAGALGLALGGCGSDADSPGDFVRGEYKRAASMDLDGGSRAYTSKDSVSAVERAITKDWRPIERHAATGSVYLRFGNDVVSVQPNGSGSVIRVEDIATACPRYKTQLGINWTCNRSGDDRGGGPGEGK
jgi:hypothetical protein